MNFQEYKVNALKWAYNQAVKDPTYEFGPYKLAITIETPDQNGEFVKTKKYYDQLCSLLRQLEIQGILRKIRQGNDKIGKFTYSQEYYTIADTDNKMLLNIIGLPGMNKKSKDKIVLKVNSDDDIYETAFTVYKKNKQIGEGGSGTVYLVQNDEGVSFGLKTLSLDKATSSKIKRFKNELMFCYHCKCEGVIKVLDYGYKIQNDIKYLFYVMPFYNKTLRNLINDGIKAEDALKYTLQLIETFEYIHKELVYHRDIKPENILFDNEKNTLILADFGISHFEEENLYTFIKTNNKERLGNFQYSAYEQRVRDGIVDHRADLYALGLIINEMFTKKLAHGTSFTKIGDINKEYGFLDSLVDALLSQSPSDRPESATILRSELLTRAKIADSQKICAQLLQNKPTHRSIADRIYQNPIVITDRDYENSSIDYILNQPPDSDWVQIFTEVSNSERAKAISGTCFEIFENHIYYNVTHDQDVQNLTNSLKNYIKDTNGRYCKAIEESEKELELDRQNEINEKIKMERKRQEVLRKIKI